MSIERLFMLAAVVALAMSGCGGTTTRRSPDPVPRASAIGRYAGAVVAFDDLQRPLVLAVDESNLVFVRCGDVDCHSYTSRVIGSANRGNFVLIARSGAPPVIVYSDAGAPPQIVQCKDPDCASAELEQIVPFAYDDWHAVADGKDLVIIARDAEGLLYKLRCSGSDCGERWWSPVPMPPLQQFAVSVSRDALWIFGILSEQTAMEVVRCDPATCSRVSKVAAADTWLVSIDADDAHPSAVLTQTGAYQRDPVTSLRLINCSTGECTEPAVPTWPAVPTNYARIALRPGGLPIVAFNDARTDALRLVLCSDHECVDAREMRVGNGAVLSVAVGTADVPVVASSHGDGVILLTRCTAPTCTATTSTTINLRDRIE